jgi:hypothetical protein
VGFGHGSPAFKSTASLSILAAIIKELAAGLGEQVINFVPAFLLREKSSEKRDDADGANHAESN